MVTEWAYEVKIQRALSVCGERYPNDFGSLLAALYESMWAKGWYIYPEHEFKPIVKNVLGELKAEEIIHLVCILPVEVPEHKLADKSVEQNWRSKESVEEVYR